MTKHQINWILASFFLLLSVASIYVGAIKNAEIQEESLRLQASNAGCVFGVVTVADDDKNGRKNPNYDAEEDMQQIDFSKWEVSKKELPVFKKHFQKSMVACYRRYT